jgi:hypothetical protein
MISIHADFDGKVIVPDEPLDLPCGEALIVRVEPVKLTPRPAEESPESSLGWLLKNASDSPALATDLAREHDHYLYGSSKRDS